MCAKRGLVEIIDKNSTENRRWYNGFDVGFTARARGASLYGGVTAGKQTTVYCEVDDPNSLGSATSASSTCRTSIS